MKFAGKVVGGAIGLLAGGPVGAAVGVLLGHQFDEYTSGSRDDARLRADPNALAVGEHFFRSAFRVMGHIAKADGHISESEIAAARAVMSDLRLNDLQVRTAIDHFNTGKQPGFNLAGELASLANAARGRPALMRTFMEIQVRAALSGNNMEGPARQLLGFTANRLNVTMVEMSQIEAVLRIRNGTFRQQQQQHQHTTRINPAEQIQQAYSVLECAPSSSDGEVVKAYRRQLSRNHPDKLKANGLPESMIEHAKQRTQQIIEAYELIKERRGIS